jgi:hypothetical protein
MREAEWVDVGDRGKMTMSRIEHQSTKNTDWCEEMVVNEVMMFPASLKKREH